MLKVIEIGYIILKSIISITLHTIRTMLKVDRNTILDTSESVENHRIVENLYSKDLMNVLS